MSTLTNMQALVASAKAVLDPAMKRLATLLPACKEFHYGLGAGERELKVAIYAVCGPRESNEISHFSLSYLPGCREVMVLHGVAVDPTLRSLGVGALLHACRLDIARGVGAKVVLCTVLSGNSAEKSIISRAGWRVALPVHGQVEMWSREL